MLQLQFGLKRAVTERAAFVMGIVNTTPDSFYAESRGGIDRALQLIDEGADILDIGGESTRPGYTPVSAEEEISRVLPVIQAVRKVSSIPISVDTYKISVFKAAFAAGADIWNDVTALGGTGKTNADGTASCETEPSVDAAEYLAKSGASVILMHSGPGSVSEVSDFLGQRVVFCLANGMNSEKIIVDPGIGFGKTYEQNIALIREPLAVCGGRYPVLMALSRKRCIGEMCERNPQNSSANDRLAGTLAADLISIQNGSKIIRVHDVSSAIDTLNVMKKLR